MHKLHKVLSDTWAVQADKIDSFLSVLVPCIVSGRLDSAGKLLGSSLECSAMSPGNTVGKWDLDDTSVPDGSVAVVEMSGMLFSWDSDRLVDCIASIEMNPKICGAVLVIDGPGGMASHLEQAASAVAGCSKPIASVVTGMMASAHFWLGTSAHRTFAASALCQVGSVGAMTSCISFRKYYESLGIDCRDIYPDSSDLKNREWRDFEEKGDDEAIKRQLGTLHMAFNKAVSENLGIEYDPKSPLFRGQMFMGDEAVKLGFIDEMGGVRDAVLWVLGEATRRMAEEYI